jgi:predicted negative regulator of RcsB-dependent stress response
VDGIKCRDPLVFAIDKNRLPGRGDFDYFSGMTSQTTESEFDFGEFFAKNQKVVTAAAATIVAIGLGYWFWAASSERKADRAEQAYAAAERSVYSGNPQLAKTDLERVVQRYANTTAGVRAAILLAKQHLKAEKPSDAIPVLRGAADQGAAKPFRTSIYALLGSAFEAENKFDSAAAAYRSAADATTLTAEKELQQASAARALAASGKKEEALELWRAIAARETSPLAGEAKLRIAELSATPAKG